MIRCTATSKAAHKNRCVRWIGHGGNHRVIIEGKVCEFSDSNADHPPTGFPKKELEAIARGDFE